MTVNTLMSNLRVLLGAETEEVVATETVQSTEKFEDLELVDGTKVQVEGELEVGKVLSVLTEEGPTPAPASIHETTEGLLITVGEAGIIEAIEEKQPEPEAEEEVAEEKVEIEEVCEEEVKSDNTELLTAIAELIQPYQTEIEDLKKQMVTLSEKFEILSDEPAAAPIKRTFSETAKAQAQLAESKFDRLVSFRNKNK